MSVFTSRIDTASSRFVDNRSAMLELVAQLRTAEGQAETKSESKAEKFAKRGQLTPRQRVALLLDPGAPFLELGNLAGYLVDNEDPAQSIPGGSSIVGIGFVRGTRVMVAASDAGIGAGAITIPGLDKTLRAQDIADQLGISKNTCRGYIKSLLCKLDAHTQLEAVANARRRGLVTDP